MGTFLLIIIIVAVVLYIYHQFETKEIQVHNLKNGGLRFLFPELVTFFENELKMYFVEDTGDKFSYSTRYSDEINKSGFLTISVFYSATREIMLKTTFTNSIGVNFEGYNVYFYRKNDIALMIHSSLKKLYDLDVIKKLKIKIKNPIFEIEKEFNDF